MTAMVTAVREAIAFMTVKDTVGAGVKDFTIVKDIIEAGVIATTMHAAIFALGVSVSTMHRVILCTRTGENIDET